MDRCARDAGRDRDDDATLRIDDAVRRLSDALAVRGTVRATHAHDFFCVEDADEALALLAGLVRRSDPRAARRSRCALRF